MEAIEIINLKDFGSGENSNQNAYIAPVSNGVDYEILSHNKELLTRAHERERLRL